MITLTGIPILTTERLTLRGPVEADAEALAAFYQSPRSRFNSGPLPAAQAMTDLRQGMGDWALRGYGLWTITLAETGQPIGRAGIMVNKDWHEPELAWLLFDGFEGQGYAFEATLAARQHLCGVMRMPPLFSGIHIDNHRSRALALRLGAVMESATPLFGDTYHLYRHPGAAG